MPTQCLPVERYLVLAHQAVALLEQALAILHGEPDPIGEPAVNNLFGAADAFTFALARYRADYPAPTQDPGPF